MKKMLIIEDDPAILHGLNALLTNEHYELTAVKSGKEGLIQSKTRRWDLIILDLTLPDMDGIEICREIRYSGIKTPILMLTARKEEMDKVLGLEIGADDYVTKPFSSRELLARIHALLRRGDSSIKEIDEFSFGNIHIDVKKQEAYKNNIPIEMSTLEFKILKYFFQHAGEVINRDKLLDEVWGYETYPTTRTVDNYILSIRKKIEDDYTDPKHLLTIYKAGYKFVV